LGLAGFDGGFDHAAIGFSGYGAGTACAAGSSCSADAMEVDFVCLGGFVVEDCFYVLDV
jgi:hypothetical protein